MTTPLFPLQERKNVLYRHAFLNAGQKLYILKTLLYRRGDRYDGMQKMHETRRTFVAHIRSRILTTRPCHLELLEHPMVDRSIPPRRPMQTRHELMP